MRQAPVCARDNIEPTRPQGCSRSSLAALYGLADERYDLSNRQDGGLMIDLVDPDGVTAEWLTEVFAAEGVLRSGSVVSCAAEPLAAMSFTGVFRRLELSYDADEPGLPRTLIAKFSTPDPEERAAIHSMGFYGREAAFYREFAPITPVPVPVCYYAAVDENDGRCVILLEDLTTARRGRSTDACTPAEVERAIEAIAPLHARWWQKPDVEFRRWLDPEAIMPLEATQPEFQAQWPVFLEKLSIPITDEVRQFGEWAAVELRTVMQRLFYEPPLTVIHHDFQADNLLFGRGLGLGAARRDRLADAGARSRSGGSCLSAQRQHGSRRPQAARARSSDTVRGGARGSRGSGLRRCPMPGGLPRRPAAAAGPTRPCGRLLSGHDSPPGGVLGRAIPATDSCPDRQRCIRLMNPDPVPRRPPVYKQIAQLSMAGFTITRPFSRAAASPRECP